MASYVVFIYTNATLWDSMAYQAPNRPGVKFTDSMDLFISSTCSVNGDCPTPSQSGGLQQSSTVPAARPPMPTRRRWLTSIRTRMESPLFPDLMARARIPAPGAGAGLAAYYTGGPGAPPAQIRPARPPTTRDLDLPAPGRPTPSGRRQAQRGRGRPGSRPRGAVRDHRYRVTACCAVSSRCCGRGPRGRRTVLHADLYEDVSDLGAVRHAAVGADSVRLRARRTGPPRPRPRPRTPPCSRSPSWPAVNSRARRCSGISTCTTGSAHAGLRCARPSAAAASAPTCSGCCAVTASPSAGCAGYSWRPWPTTGR